jgi:hypothetical protein
MSAYVYAAQRAPRHTLSPSQALLLTRPYASLRGRLLQRVRLQTVRTTSPKPKLPHDQLVFGKTFADHMLEIPWTASAGWGAPLISPYHKLSLEPSASVFHYASEVGHRHTRTHGT